MDDAVVVARRCAENEPAIDEPAVVRPAPSGDPAARRPRLDSLTGLRWWAAFAVFLHHMSNLAPMPIEGVLRYGAYGVTFFFVLSGFVLTWSARPGTPASTFWWRRFARIYPSHIVALVLALNLLGDAIRDALDPKTRR